MTTPVELPDDFDPRIPVATAAVFAAARANVQAEMDRVAGWNGFLRLHGVSESDVATPESPWDSSGKVRPAGYRPTPPAPGLPPVNGGLLPGSRRR